MIERHVFSDQWRADRALCAMFEARRLVFIDLLRWDLPVTKGGFELDQFDALGARYLILRDLHGGHLASARLLPTTRPHLLDDHYAHLNDGIPQIGDGVWEITRFCLDRRLRASWRRIVRDQLITGLVEYAHDHHIGRYVAVAQTSWASKISQFGWHCTSLGGELAGPLAAIAIDIDGDTLGLLADKGIGNAAGEPAADLAA